MKLMIYKEREKDDKIRLSLYDNLDTIWVCVKNKDGEIINNLLTISEDGIKLCNNVNYDFGFPLDEHGRIKIIGE